MALKPGTYDAITPSLPPLPPEDPARQEKIEQIKAVITYRDATTLASDYIQLRKEKEAINARLSAVEIRVKAYEQLLTESLDAKAAGWGLHGVKHNALRLVTGETVRIQKEPYGKVIDKEAFRLWCMAPADRCMTCEGDATAYWHDEDNEDYTHQFKPGGGYERQLQLWPSTMNGVVKERLLAGEEPPDGTEAFSYVKVMFVKAGTE